jgi:hypothetical protein
MPEVLAHPITVATYAALLGLLITAGRGAVRLWHRLGNVERSVDHLDRKVDELARDLREHMAEEGRNIGRLETLIRSLHDK